MQRESSGAGGTAELVVHTTVGSPFGRSVLAVLEEKGVAYRLRLFAPDAFRSPGHVARHPFGRVPWIEEGGFRLYETQAILRYLERKYPAPALTPAGIQRQARMDQIMNINDCYLYQGVGFVIGFQRFVRPLWLGEQSDEAVVAAAMPLARIILAELASILGGNAYLAGDEISLADFTVASHLAFLSGQPEWAGLIAPHAALQDWFARMMARPSLATTAERLADKARAG